MPDITVTVRYPGYTRRAVIRQNRQSVANRKRTISGRPYAQMWHVVRWLDEKPPMSRSKAIGSVRRKRGKYGKRKAQAAPAR